jgi:Fe2+ transport system protein FeoA
LSDSHEIRLSEAQPGTRLRIKHLHSKPGTSLRLRELGLCEEAVIRCVSRSHGNVICEVFNTRIGLNFYLASGILVSVLL